MKIVLAELSYKDARGRSFPSLYPGPGILYLISNLREKIEGVDVHYLDGLRNLDSHLKFIETVQPDVYGLSFTSPYASLAYRTINAVKEKFPSLPVICGGPHPTADYQDVFKQSAADVCCIGEGEVTAVELVKAYMGGGDLSDVAGIAYREGDQIRRTVNRPFVKELDTIPFPAWDLVDFNRYPGDQKYRGKPSACLVASRGCPFDCVFCSNPVWKLQKPWVRLRSPRNIVEEVEYLYQRGVREIYIRSDEMNPNHAWCVAVFKAIAELNHKDLFFQCNLKANKVTEELAQALSEANCWVIHLGIESGSQRVLDGINKRVTSEEVEQACRNLKKYGVRIFGFFMMYQVWEKDGELCVETPKEVDNTLSFVRKLRSQKLIDYMSWSFATPYPGSRLYDIALKYNLVRPSLQGRQPENIWDISMDLPGISARDMRLSRTKGFMLQGYFALTSEGFFKRRNFRANLGRAVKKVRYILQA